MRTALASCEWFWVTVNGAKVAKLTFDQQGWHAYDASGSWLLDAGTERQAVAEALMKVMDVKVTGA